ncbi:MAG: rod shape-determining protein [Candidatus Brennerbacteria bacterium CG11_big_fil_rev_8_21_14_0_20_43_10]|uniref:Cell shape-determining protein MreB n=2 Tax=Candidatus Brenneribacteriota TaxID=1817902 RepID=A0A2H9N446_9BACT|nr:MAG: rod shape-determining protein [Parcubacteria group bacterium CG1_02_44_31]PIR26119.1 MAG: rod shape-determining protein [Candidatus Brennerbacteria bacterium CG11_big_fil_rev_8_21_14_0_20_43_10]PIX28637.1 MAG: rod shape-determining protein [Candidatus Brennerbacteria bacterium CG_4_8_14_3_um_filter_43_14]PJA19708.1 MAG: rod shape-determining protein [Candidatus Brennerbacteria bacterium CG_4_10_14_0_2_um_filter_43_14]
MFIRQLGIDLGTANTLVFVPKQGVIIQEPTVVAVTKPGNRVLAIGVEAKEMIGKTPADITVYRPMRDGVIADYRVTQAILRYFIQKACGFWKFFKPEILVSVPAGSTSTEQKAVIDAAREAGARSTYVVKEPILAAIGAGIPINSPVGNMVVNIGGGTSEIAVISLGGIVSWSSIRVAGDRMDQAILDFLKKKYNLAIGEKTAEEVKIKVGSAMPLTEKEKMTIQIRGQDIIEGLPKNIEITSNDVAEAIGPQLKEIVQAIKNVLRDTPPELSADIIDRGMILTGGGSQLRNLDALIFKATGVPAYVADEAMFCVAKGTGIILDNIEIYKRSVQSFR